MCGEEGSENALRSSPANARGALGLRPLPTPVRLKCRPQFPFLFRCKATRPDAVQEERSDVILRQARILVQQAIFVTLDSGHSPSGICRSRK